ncbi:MAG TPA: type II toxin-antitoxin system VapC family toxin [Leeuwenhoekiella sp.]|nr:type II toxin-antitoxin system VapC family toxin [Leeuwenhoekiella sp.]
MDLNESYLLDTNICIYLFRGKYNIDDFISTVGTENCFISEITLAELTYGAEHSRNPKKNLDIINRFIENITIIPITKGIPIYAKEKARLRKAGTLIGDFDLLIGTTAIAHDMVMVSQNVNEFQRLENINLENWIIQ